MQSLIATSIFYRWRFGLWGKVGPATQLVLALAIYFLISAAVDTVAAALRMRPARIPLAARHLRTKSRRAGPGGRSIAMIAGIAIIAMIHRQPGQS